VKGVKRLRRAAGDAWPPRVAIVLGSGLADAVLARIDGTDVAYRKLGAPKPSVQGHTGVARVGRFGDVPVVAFAGRAHLYEGRSAHDVAFFVRLAAACGATTVILTNAAGGLREGLRVGDAMLIADHLNLTGTSPLPLGDARFVDMTAAYDPVLRASVLETMPEVAVGVYAGVRGPQYETPAEAAAIEAMGADAVGMSTVLETIAARALGIRVVGISLITNEIGEDSVVSHAVLDASRRGAETIATIVDTVIRSTR